MDFITSDIYWFLLVISIVVLAVKYFLESGLGKKGLGNDSIQAKQLIAGNGNTRTSTVNFNVSTAKYNQINSALQTNKFVGVLHGSSISEYYPDGTLLLVDKDKKDITSLKEKNLIVFKNDKGGLNIKILKEVDKKNKILNLYSHSKKQGKSDWKPVELNRVVGIAEFKVNL